MTFASFIEPLRQVNRLTGRMVYKWSLLSADGEAVTASSGAQVNVDNDLQELPEIDYVFVCSGVEVENFNDEYSYAWLRKMSKRGVKIGALSTADTLCSSPTYRAPTCLFLSMGRSCCTVFSAHHH